MQVIELKGMIRKIDYASLRSLEVRVEDRYTETDGA